MRKKLATGVAEPHARPGQRRQSATLYRVLGYALVLAGVPMFMSVLLTPVGIALFAASYWSFRRARKHAAVLADDVLAKDTRAPVLYLRSFDDEEQDNRLGAVLNARHTNIAGSTPAWGPREQDALAAVLARIGPYIAIGKPGEPLPELGAARTYVSDAAWQAKIHQWLEHARLVILRAGATQGLRWELSELVRRSDPRQLLVILPTSAENYSAFTKWANEVLPQPLPASLPEERLLCFDEAWLPTRLPPRTSITKTLAPFFAQNGIELRSSFFEDFLEHNGLTGAGVRRVEHLWKATHRSGK
jgi:hypothetical protein